MREKNKQMKATSNSWIHDIIQNCDSYEFSKMTIPNRSNVFAEFHNFLPLLALILLMFLRQKFLLLRKFTNNTVVFLNLAGFQLRLGG